MCSLEEDLQGMNLSLHVELDFDGEQERFEIERREEGEERLERKEDEDGVAVSRRSEVPDIPAGRFRQVFLA